MLLLPLIVGGVGVALYLGRSHIAWLQNTASWFRQSQLRWADRPHPIQATKSAAASVSRKAVDGYASWIERTKLIMPSQQPYTDATGTVWVPLPSLRTTEAPAAHHAFSAPPPPA